MKIDFLLPSFFVLPEGPTSPAQAPPIDGFPKLSPARVMYSTLLQLRTHVETENLEGTTLKQLVQRLQRDFALLQPQVQLIDQSTTSEYSSLMTLKNKIKVLEKRSLLKRADTNRGLILYNISYQPWVTKPSSLITATFISFCGRLPPYNSYLSPPIYGI